MIMGDPMGSAEKGSLVIIGYLGEYELTLQPPAGFLISKMRSPTTWVNELEMGRERGCDDTHLALTWHYHVR